MDNTARERMRRYRNRKRNETVTNSVTKGSVTGQNVTKSVTVGVTQYPAIAEALIDPVKRAKLGRICYQLNSRGLSKEVRYGVNGPSFDVVSELLHITEPD